MVVVLIIGIGGGGNGGIGMLLTLGYQVPNRTVLLLRHGGAGLQSIARIRLKMSCQN